MITKVYYSLANGGDGSGYPVWFEDQICSDFHQSIQEGWGEDCSGYIEIESDGPVKVKEATSYKDYVNELKEELEDYDYDSYIRKEMNDFILQYEASIREEKINNIIKD